jgi:hypothetical protein
VATVCWFGLLLAVIIGLIDEYLSLLFLISCSLGLIGFCIGLIWGLLT